MIDAQILVKKGKLLSLHSTWNANFLNLADTIKKTYIQQKESYMLEEGERREFVSDSLYNLDPLWNDIIALLTEQSEEKTIYFFNPHTWYILGMEDTEARLFNGIKKIGGKVLYAFGHDTFLDQYGRKLLQLQGVHTLVYPNHPFPKENYILNIFGDFILEVLLPDSLVRHFRFFFDNTKSMKDFDPQLFTDIFQMKAKCKLTLRRSKKDAEELKKIFREWFEGKL